MNLSKGMVAKIWAVCHTPFYAEYVDNRFGEMEPAHYFFKAGSRYLIDIKALFEPNGKDGFYPFEISPVVLIGSSQITLLPWQLNLFTKVEMVSVDRVSIDDVESPAPEKPTLDGSITIYADIEPDAQEGDIPTLECEKATVFKVDYNDLDEFLSEVYSIQFEIVAEEELNNYSSMDYDVKPEPMDKYWQERFKDGRYSTRQLLNQACFDKLIEPGNYIIDVSW